jgi:hypothetical protein
MNRIAVAGAAAALAAVLTAIGQFKGSTFTADWPAWLLELAAIAIATGLVFWLAVPLTLRAGDPRATTRTAVILSVVGFLTLVVFWLGLPTVIAAGAAYLAANVLAGVAGLARVLAIAALAVAGLTVTLAVVLAFIG